MKNNKIAFIYCVNDWNLYEESTRYVKSLNLPKGFEIELIPIENAQSMTSGYNQGMMSTDARYKVYMHQDVFIINKDFLIDTIKLFKSNTTLGMLGVIGAKTIPESGVWWESKDKIGKVYDSHKDKIELLEYNSVEQEVEPVNAIDGLLMMTQYDITWKEDVIKGWHFYDISQCIEFLNQGYIVGIPEQKEAWCIHDCGLVNINNYDHDRKIFIEEYLEKYIETNTQNKENDYKKKLDNYYQGINYSIFNLINPNAENVLDIGCAQGNLGSAIKQKYGSKVFGFEAFPFAAEIAKTKLDHVYTGDIESYNFNFKNEIFDHIIFGDVLEHLYDPWGVLCKVRPYLKKEGSIISSIPNVGHITVLTDLLCGNWTYRDSGLLDKTHLRFFTLREIDKMFDYCGYKIEQIKRIEVTNDYYNMFIKGLIGYLESMGINREHFFDEIVTYQYVVKAIKK
jgi:2-polyprenyl-3-methyl-5-hydroxy-6-metoxy-1,4-benzoquinol methylase